MKKAIVYILSVGHSGSTVLDKAIGSHSQCFSTGELCNIKKDLENNGLCGCGVSLRECQFWGNIFEVLNEKYQLNIKNRPADFPLKFRVNNLSNISKFFYKVKNFLNLFGFFKYNRFNRFKNEIRNNLELYKTIFNNIDENILIDSSKNIWKPLLIRGHVNNEFDLKYIFLVRDGRGVLNSYQKRSYCVILPDNDGEIKKNYYPIEERPAPLDVIRGWKKYNLKLILLYKLNKKNTHFIRHEDFLSDPELELNKICNFLKIDYEKEMLNLERKKNHMIGGNVSRINAKKIIKSKSNWENLDPKLKKLFEKKAGWLNKYFKYF